MADRYWVGGNGTWDTVSGLHWSNRTNGTGGFSVPTYGDNVFFDSVGGTVNLIYSPNVNAITFGSYINVNINNNSITANNFTLNNQASNIDFGSSGTFIVQPSQCNANSTIYCFDVGVVSTSYTTGLFLGSRQVVVDTSLLANFNCTIDVSGTYTAGSYPYPVPDNKYLNLSVVGNNTQRVSITDTWITIDVSDSYIGNLVIPIASVTRSFVMGNNCPGVEGGSLRFCPDAGNVATLITRGKAWNADIFVSSRGNGNAVGSLVLQDEINPNISLMNRNPRIDLDRGILDFNGKNVNFSSLWSGSGLPREFRRNGATLTLVVRPEYAYGTLFWQNPQGLILDSAEDPFYVKVFEGCQLQLAMYGNAQYEDSFPSIHLIDSSGNNGATTNLNLNTPVFTNFTMDESFDGDTTFSYGASVFGNLIHSNSARWQGGTGAGVLRFCSAKVKTQYFDFKDKNLYLGFECNVANGALSVIGGFNSAYQIGHVSGEFYFDPNYSIVSGESYYAPPGNTFRVFDLGRADIRLSGTGNVWTSYGCDNYLMNGPESTLLLNNNFRDRYITLSENLSFGNVMIGGNSNPSISTLTIFNGNVTFGGVFGANVTGNHTIQFTSGTTTTLNGWNVVGNSTTRLGISSNGISQHYLNIQSGSINANSLRISLSNASSNVPGLVWFAGNNSIDGGQNDGWVFANIPPPPESYGDAFFIMDNP